LSTFRYAYRLNEIALLNRPGDAGRGRVEMLVEDTSAVDEPIAAGSGPRRPVCKLAVHDCSREVLLVNGNALAHGLREDLHTLAAFIERIPAHLNGRPESYACEAARELEALDRSEPVLRGGLGRDHVKVQLEPETRPGHGRVCIDIAGTRTGTVTLDVIGPENAAFKCGQLADAIRRFADALTPEIELARQRLTASIAAHSELPQDQRKPTYRDDDVPF
jgi:hypothetical protein